MKIKSDTVKHNADKLLEALENLFGKIEIDQQITRRLMHRIQSSILSIEKILVLMRTYLHKWRDKLRRVMI